VQNPTVQERRVRWRGESWHVRRVAGFENASACVVSSREIPAVEANALALGELFVT
jgi:hypothetical protein